MSRYTVTLVGLLLMTSFGIFFGIEIATRGMERIQGPIPATDYRIESGAPASNTAAVGPGRNATGTVRQPAATAAPQTQPGTSSTSGTKGLVSGTAPQAGAGHTPLPPIGANAPSGPADSNVNRLGNGIGNMLQGAAHQTIRVVVGIFDGLVN